MTTFARVVNDVCIETTDDPETKFHADIAAQFEVVPDGVVAGSTRDASGNWALPAQLDVAPDAPKVSPVQFKLLFTPQERVAMNAARSTDPVIEDLFEVLDDPRLTFVDLGLQSTKDAIGYLVSTGLLTQQRADEVLLGVLR